MLLKRYKTLFLLCFAFSTPAAYAQTAYKLSVDSLFALGIENSLKIQSSQLSVTIASNDIADKKSYRLPDISIGLIGGYVGNPTTFGHGLSAPKQTDIPSWSQNYNINLSEPIYQGGRLKNAIDKASLQKEIAKLNVEYDVAEVKLLLINRYLELIRLYKQKDVIEKSIAQSKSQLHDIREMSKNGMITNSDVLRSELQLSRYQLGLSEVENNIVIISQEIDIALGLDEDLILLPENNLLEDTYQILSYDKYVEMAYSSYPELKVAQSYVQVAKKEVQLVRSDYLPSLSVKAGNILSRPITGVSPALDLYANNWNVSLALSYNLSSLYRNKWKMSIAKEALKQQDLSVASTMQGIRRDVKTYFIKHHESLERIETLSISVKQAEENYRIVLNKYRNHLAILTDLLDAGSVQLEAEFQLITAKADAVFTYYQLQRASGNL